MIRYRISKTRLETEITAESANWLTNAQARTLQHQTAGQFTTKSPNWSDIKQAFIRLQHAKCAYCERKLEGGDFGVIEHDVEHFRPKNTVEVWPNSTAIDEGISFPFNTGTSLPGGYFLLGHNVQNYATSCKTCNSTLKSGFFPIDSNRVANSLDIADYEPEKPLLPFPLGDRGFKPETVIEFSGILAIPRFKSGYKHRMGRVTIDFFRLNQRERLREERARRIAELNVALTQSQTATGTALTIANRVVLQLTESSQSHSSCAKSYVKLFTNDRATADAQAVAALDFLESLS